jgi:hypothetical protein
MQTETERHWASQKGSFAPGEVWFPWGSAEQLGSRAPRHPGHHGGGATAEEAEGLPASRLQKYSKKLNCQKLIHEMDS